MQFLHDSFVQFILTTIISIAALILSIVFYFKQRNRKDVSWERISVAPAKGLKGTSLIILQLRNSGNVSIIESDFRAPLKFNFGKIAKVANVAVVNTKPPGLKEVADKAFRRDSHYLNKTMIAPFLFNANYAITFQVQVAGFRGEITVENRTSIFGVYEIHEIRPLAETSKGKLLFLSLLFILGGQVLGYAIQSQLYPLVDNQTSPFLLLLASHFLILFLKNFAVAVFFSYAYSNRLLSKIKSTASLIILWIKLSVAITIVSLVILLPGLIGRQF